MPRRVRRDAAVVGRVRQPGGHRGDHGDHGHHGDDHPRLLPGLQDKKVSSAGDDEVGVAVGGVDGHPVPQPGGHSWPWSTIGGVASQLSLASKLDLR